MCDEGRLAVVRGSPMEKAIVIAHMRPSFQWFQSIYVQRRAALTRNRRAGMVAISAISGRHKPVPFFNLLQFVFGLS
jgi:hypothetical protein